MKFSCYQIFLLCLITCFLLSCSKERSKVDLYLSESNLEVNKSPARSIESVGRTQDDKKQGKWVFFDKNGNKVREVEYMDGEIQGLYTEFREGRILSIVNYKGGIKEGFAKYYNHYCGTVNAEGNYLHDKKSGLWFEYNNGELLAIESFKKGKVVKTIFSKELGNKMPPSPEEDAAYKCCCNSEAVY